MLVSLPVSSGIEVQPDVLDSGAATASYAGGLAKRAAAALGGAGLPHGMFGDFEAAHGFHRTVTSTHDHHVNKLNSHHVALTGTSEKVYAVAQNFRAADDGVDPGISV